MRIGLIINHHRDVDYEVASSVYAVLTKLGATVVLPPDESVDFARARNITIAPFSTCDLLLCLGGDGTFLRASSKLETNAIPLAGVHLGSLGFLPEIQRDTLPEQLAQLVSGNYRIEHRLRLEATMIDNVTEEHCRVALNDLTVMRGSHGRLLELEISFNGDLATRLRGDGVIVATPTGSTAYSLAAGGPVVHPAMAAIVLTPVCPHSLAQRSMVINHDTTIQISTISQQYGATVAVDGEDWCSLSATSRLEISRAKHDLHLIRLGSDDFFERVSNKLSSFGGMR